MTTDDTPPETRRTAQARYRVDGCMYVFIYYAVVTFVVYCGVVAWVPARSMTDLGKTAVAAHV
jgi:hypothetical protein